MKSAIKPDATFRNAKPASKPYKITDGAGLYLLIKSNGAKLWQMRYQYHGKAKTLSFGDYKLTTLAEAREARDRAKKLLQQGVDPSEAKREAKRATIRNAQNTFKATALEWYEVNKGKWSQGYIPGTGMSYSTYRPHTNAPKAAEGSIATERMAYRMWMWVALVAIGFFVLSRLDYIKSGLM